MRELTAYLRAKQKLADKLGFYPLFDVEYSKEKWDFDCLVGYTGTLQWEWDTHNKEFVCGEDAVLKVVIDDKYTVFHIFGCIGEEYLQVMVNSKMKPQAE